MIDTTHPQSGSQARPRAVIALSAVIGTILALQLGQLTYAGIQQLTAKAPLSVATMVLPILCIAINAGLLTYLRRAPH